MGPKINILTGNLLGEGGTQSGKISPREWDELLSCGHRPDTEPPRGTPCCSALHSHTRRPLRTPHLPATEDRKQVKKERPRLSCSILSSQTYCLRATVCPVFSLCSFLTVLTCRFCIVITITENRSSLPCSLSSAVGTLQVFVKNTSYRGSDTFRDFSLRLPQHKNGSEGGTREPQALGGRGESFARKQGP